MQQAVQKRQQLNLFADVEELKPKPGEKEWQKLLTMLDGEAGEWLGSEMSDLLKKMTLDKYDGKTVRIIATQKQVADMENLLDNNVLKINLANYLVIVLKATNVKRFVWIIIKLINSFTPLTLPMG